MSQQKNKVTFSILGNSGPNIFQRESLVRRLLPWGCFTIVLSKCSSGHDVNMIMSSTSPWYQPKSDPRTLYTDGIVFVELNSLAIPVSITGIQVEQKNTSFRLVSGVLEIDSKDGNPHGNHRESGCWEFKTTPRSIYYLLANNSFIKTFFEEIENLLPDWLTFSPDGDVTFNVNDLQTELTNGADIQQGECRGAPLFPDHTYTMLKFGKSFSMSLYGQDIKLSSLNSSFCIIIDICQDLGGSVFVILPEDSRNMSDSFDIMESLIDKFGFRIRPVGFGLSLAKQLNVHAQTTELQMWNGDHLFQYQYVICCSPWHLNTWQLVVITTFRNMTTCNEKTTWQFAVIFFPDVLIHTTCMLKHAFQCTYLLWMFY